MGGLAKKGSLPPPRSTKASTLLTQSRRYPEDDPVSINKGQAHIIYEYHIVESHRIMTSQDKKLFKMKRFEKVPCKVNSYSNRSRRSNEEGLSPGEDEEEDREEE